MHTWREGWVDFEVLECTELIITGTESWQVGAANW